MPSIQRRPNNGGDLVSGLRLLRRELEDAVHRGVVGSVGDIGCEDDLHASVAFVTDCVLRALESPPGHTPIPSILLTWTRRAARGDISIDRVIRACVGGYAALSELLLDEAVAAQIEPAEQRLALATASTYFNQIVEAVCEEYRESSSPSALKVERQGQHIKRLLAGERVEVNDIGYDFGGWHIGIVVCGAARANGLREIAKALDCRLLYTEPRSENTLWAWLGRSRPILDYAGAITSFPWTAPVYLAFGEPGKGIPGWRLSHRQAAAALPIAMRGPDRIVHYADVAVIASAIRDDLLVTSLSSRYLSLLEGEREGTRALRDTLRAYFDADRNTSSAAAALGVSRHTVASRLRRLEERLGRPLSACAVELQVALQLDGLAI